MNKVLKSGTNHQILNSDNVEVFDSLPVGNYTVDYNEQSDSYSLEPIGEFALPDKIYGDVHKNTTRILNTFSDRLGNTGVALNGEKGSGKTLLAKSVSITGALQGIPTVVINNPYHGDNFNKFIQSINIPCIVFFDEFEKIYDIEAQEKVLTLLDGVYDSKKLFIITTNKISKVSQYLVNRPGRIYYSIDYEVIDPVFIEEFLNDRLDDKESIDEILLYCKIYTMINFDMLSSIVEEMNRYSDSFKDVLKLLNVKPEVNSLATYKAELVVDSKYKVNCFANNANFDPFECCIWIEAGNEGITLTEEYSVEDLVLEDFSIDDKHLVEFKADSSTFIYKLSKGGHDYRLEVTPEKPEPIKLF